MNISIVNPILRGRVSRFAVQIKVKIVWFTKTDGINYNVSWSVTTATELHRIMQQLLPVISSRTHFQHVVHARYWVTTQKSHNQFSGRPHHSSWNPFGRKTEHFHFSEGTLNNLPCVQKQRSTTTLWCKNNSCWISTQHDSQGVTAG